MAPGPVETLWHAARRGEIALAEALRRAREPQIAASLSATYAGALGSYAMDTDRLSWRDALLLARILLAAASGDAQTDDALLARMRASWAFIAVATRALMQIPDGRVYHEAVSAANWLRRRAPQNDTRREETMFRLAFLHLDPYLYDANVANYERSYEIWRSRLPEALGPAYALLEPRDVTVPSPRRALAVAEGLLRRVLTLAHGEERPSMIKALLQAAGLRAALAGTELSGAEFAALAAELLATVDAQADPKAFIAAVMAASQFGALGPPDVERHLRELFAPGPGVLIDRYGVDVTLDMLFDAMRALRRICSPYGLELADEYRIVIEDAGERAEQTLWRLEFNLFDAVPGPDGTVSPARLRSFVEQAQSENRETEAIAMLDELEREQPQFARAHVDALASLRSSLIMGLGTNAEGERAWAQAIERYSSALFFPIRRGHAEKAMTTATLIADLARNTEAGVAAAVLVTLTVHALELEKLCGERATRLVRSMCESVMHGMQHTMGGDALVLPLVQFGKGLQLASALRLGARYDVADDDEAPALLDEIARLERAVGDVVPSELDEGLLLSSYSQSSDREAGATDSERLRNLQRAFDARVQERLAADALERLPPGENSIHLITGDDPATFVPTTTNRNLRASLDARTVVLDYFLTSSDDGRVATFLLLATRERVHVVTLVDPSTPAGNVVVGSGETAAFMPWIGFIVEPLRSGVIAEPGPRVVGAEGAAALRADVETFFGPFYALLDELYAAGKDHLLVVPDGPLHFVPWPLIGPLDRPIANDWIVSCAPCLSAVIRERPEPPASPPAATMSSIALSFANDPGIPPLRESLHEAAAVAAVFGTKPIPEDAATKRAVIAALENSRYVHVSTHGLHDVAAPAFQCIYLAKEEGADRRLFAYEILARDLRGLEILTLSACETALGRFDLGGNLRGLPAAFLLAGVRVIVGTLWSVDEAATAIFFPAFYRAIEAGQTQRDAFRAAQRETRAARPKYRDWGAFHMLGDPT